MEALQNTVVGLLVPLATEFFLIVILAGSRWIADFAHFLGFLFGGAIEAMYVFGDHEADAGGEERSVSKTVGR